MSTPTPPPPGEPDERELQSWLAGLRGETGEKASPAATDGERLRRVVARDFEAAVEQVPAEELHRGWRGLQTQLAARSARARPGIGGWFQSLFQVRHWLTPQVVAAGVTSLALGVLFGPVFIEGEGLGGPVSTEAQLVLSLGDVSGSRGDATAQVFERRAADPVESSSILAEDLVQAGLGVQVYRIAATGEQQVVFMLAPSLEPPVAAILEGYGLGSAGAGVIVVRFVPE